MKHNPFDNAHDLPTGMIISIALLVGTFVILFLAIAFFGSAWILVLIPIAAACRVGYYVFKGK